MIFIKIIVYLVLDFKTWYDMTKQKEKQSFRAWSIKQIPKP